MVQNHLPKRQHAVRLSHITVHNTFNLHIMHLHLQMGMWGAAAADEDITP